MKHVIPLGIGLVLILAAGLLHGRWTDRWGYSAELHDKVARLASIDKTIEEWEGQDLPPMNPREVQVAGIAGYLHRAYVHRRTGQRVVVLLVCGPSGPIAVHPPDVCYQGAGFGLVQPHKRHPLAGMKPAAEFWVGDFAKPMQPAPAHLRILWAWSADGTWVAPEEARLAFGRRPALCKMYVIRSTTKADEPLTEDPGIAFLRVFLPELQKKLF